MKRHMKMKNPLTVIASMILLLSRLQAGAAENDSRIRRGDDASKILEVLGEPSAFIESRQRGVYYYARGEVHTRDGKVSIVRLMRPEELEKRRVAERKESRLRKAEGERKLAEILDNELFPTISAAERVAFWERFHRRYPEVDIDIHLAKARTQARLDAEEAEEEARIVRLEQRVRRAEQEASRARREAENARRLTEREKYQTRNRYIVWPHSYWVPRQHATNPHPSGYRGSSVLNSNINILKDRRTITFGGGAFLPRDTRQTTLSFMYED